jgi:tight adherence protein B
VLLLAGIGATRAWGHVVEHTEHPVARATRDADDLAAALVRASAAAPSTERLAWRSLAAGIRIATVSGAAPGPALNALADALRAASELDREIASALAGPRASARVVLALPALGLAMSALLDLGALPVLVGTPLGAGCLVVGVGLVAVAAKWSSRIVRRAQPSDPLPGLDLDLAAVALCGGLSVDRALVLLDSALADSGLPSADPAVAEVVTFAASAGAPVAGLLRAEAAQRRAAARIRGRAAADEAGVALLLPLGVCILPAFVALGVVPVIAAVLGTVTGGWG